VSFGSLNLDHIGIKSSVISHGSGFLKEFGSAQISPRNRGDKCADDRIENESGGCGVFLWSLEGQNKPSPMVLQKLP
jgi:hypothetical protein